MGSRNDKGWKIHFEKRADDEFLFHVKGIRKIISILILTVFTIIYLIDGYFRFHSLIYSFVCLLSLKEVCKKITL